MQSRQKILTVSQINEYMKLVVDSNPYLADVYIRGEISNFTNHYKTGHLYFTLKDAGGLIKSVMFRSNAENLKFSPENGMKVIVRGRIGVFVRDGVYQLYAEEMEPDGVGALYIAFEQVKAKLEAEGLFAPERKRPIPEMPGRIGIITSLGGAALRDMINVTGRRFPMAELVIRPAAVQGENAVPELISALKLFSELRNVDVIIIGRGGGSIEDLWAFNDEGVARAVADCPIPVISAVGHETDFTICDFCSDCRAPTPSAAAEIAVPDFLEVKEEISSDAARIYSAMSAKIESTYERVRALSKSRALIRPETLLDEKRMSLISAVNSLTAAMEIKESRYRTALAGTAAKLSALDPLAVISRGYSAVYKGDGKSSANIVKSVNQVSVGDRVTLRLSDGELQAEIVGK